MLIGSLAQQIAKRRRLEESEAELNELNDEVSLTNEELINHVGSRFQAFSEEEKAKIRSIVNA